MWGSKGGLGGHNKGASTTRPGAHPLGARAYQMDASHTLAQDSSFEFLPLKELLRRDRRSGHAASLGILQPRVTSDLYPKGVHDREACDVHNVAHTTSARWGSKLTLTFSNRVLDRSSKPSSSRIHCVMSREVSLPLQSVPILVKINFFFSVFTVSNIIECLQKWHLLDDL
ncbi:hypothetical protein VNO77_44300 [Canavalia gladiata]|uniref:Uncharacterized protein n=1 Tax=Canavalia gladiata TaxID=3824 RepID=A0AAN9PQ82_CANGL